MSNNGRPLRFDFAIFISNQILLLEYDGQQHFFPVVTFGGLETFLGNYRRDSIKNVYCLKNGIRLLRLPYYLSDEEIKDKINKYIKSVETTG